jgi:predicted component of type VI protein secretion system
MRSRLAIAVLLAAICGALLSACGSNQTSSQGQQACADVTKSISLYNASLDATNPAAAKALAKQATTELRLALPLAAAADANDGTWQPLEATLSESNRFGSGDSLNEGELTTSLSAQCAADLGS